MRGTGTGFRHRLPAEARRSLPGREAAGEGRREFQELVWSEDRAIVCADTEATTNPPPLTLSTLVTVMAQPPPAPPALLPLLLLPALLLLLLSRPAAAGAAADFAARGAAESAAGGGGGGSGGGGGEEEEACADAGAAAGFADLSGDGGVRKRVTRAAHGAAAANGSPAPGSLVRLWYVGRLGGPDGLIFDSAAAVATGGRGSPFAFALGQVGARAPPRSVPARRRSRLLTAACPAGRGDQGVGRRGADDARRRAGGGAPAVSLPPRPSPRAARAVAVKLPAAQVEIAHDYGYGTAGLPPRIPPCAASTNPSAGRPGRSSEAAVMCRCACAGG